LCHYYPMTTADGGKNLELCFNSDSKSKVLGISVYRPFIPVGIGGAFCSKMTQAKYLGILLLLQDTSLPYVIHVVSQNSNFKTGSDKTHCRVIVNHQVHFQAVTKNTESSHKRTCMNIFFSKKKTPSCIVTVNFERCIA
jgi:hypothetical protein